MNFYSLSACCVSATFNVSTTDFLPSEGKFVCIQTLEYSGCAEVVTYNVSYPSYTYQSSSPNEYNFVSCEDCYQFCNCEPACNNCYEYELQNNQGIEVNVEFTDCNGYKRLINIPILGTEYICAKQGTPTSDPPIIINELSTCIKNTFTGNCDKFSGYTDFSGVQIEYYDCFEGANVFNRTLLVNFTSNSEFSYCACLEGTIVSGGIIGSQTLVGSCDCESIVVSSTPTPTPTITPTPTQTPTITPTQSQTPSYTPSITPTLSLTPTFDPFFDIYLFRTCCGNIKFRFTSIPGTLIVGQIYNISGPYINECAEVITYQDEGTIYPSVGSTFTQVELCSDVLCVCPTPTPTPTPQCLCTNYNVFNGGIDGYFSYTDCDNKFINVFIGAGETYTFCACLNSLILPETFSSFLIGDCIPVSPTNQPTPTQTPSFSSTPSLCSIYEFCLNSYYGSSEIYNGNFGVAGNFNSRLYYTGDSGGYIYFNSTEQTWCLSSVVGSNCLLTGKKPCNGPCPDLNNLYFSSGVCLTTTTTTSGCEIFDFEAYFDCEPSGMTPTPSMTQTITPSPTPTPTPTDVCFSFNSNVTISAFTQTATTTTTTTTTINRSLLVTGQAIYDIVDTVFLSPGQCYVFTLCNSFTNFYIQPTVFLTNYNLVIGSAYDMNINGVRNCYTFLGASYASPNATTIEINNVYGDCTTCINNL